MNASTDKQNHDSKLSVMIPARLNAHDLRPTLERLFSYLQGAFPKRFEVVLAANGDPESLLESEITLLQDSFAGLKVVFSTPAGKGLALQRAFAATTGDYILWTDADLPYDLRFFEEAVAAMDAGIDFVSGNRRHDKSLLTISLMAQKMIYRREQLGTFFNACVRRLLGLQSRDTQAGIKAMRRELAREAFGRQCCPGFLADIEYFLVSEKGSYRHLGLPVHWTVEDSRSTVRVGRQLFVSAYWLARIARNNRMDRYSLQPLVSTHSAQEAPRRASLQITADDWGLSPGVNAGILELARRGVVTRVSMLADGPFLKEGLEELREIPGLQIGMHFALTLPAEAAQRVGLGSPRALLGWILNPLSSKTRIQQEWNRQLAVFREQAIRIHYADSHHHVHVFPRVSRVILPLMAAAGFREVRMPLDRRNYNARKLLLNLFCKAAIPVFKAEGLSYQAFLYPELPQFRDPAALLGELEGFGVGEVIVHPAAYNDFPQLQIDDPYQSERVVEFEGLLTLSGQLQA